MSKLLNSTLTHSIDVLVPDLKDIKKLFELIDQNRAYLRELLSCVTGAVHYQNGICIGFYKVRVQAQHTFSLSSKRLIRLNIHFNRIKIWRYNK